MIFAKKNHGYPTIENNMLLFVDKSRNFIYIFHSRSVKFCNVKNKSKKLNFRFIYRNPSS